MTALVQSTHHATCTKPAVGRRIAIVGGGPRGMFCLGALADAIRQRSITAEITVDIYEPAKRCGAGVVYRPNQPSHRIMNYASGQIDVWPRSAGEGRRPDERSLVGWLSDRYASQASPTKCVPRSMVGEYLSEAFDQVVAQSPASLKVHVIPHGIEEIERQGSSWRLCASHPQSYDEVLLTVGHGLPQQGTIANQSVGQVAAGSRVAMRGFALTFIDACLDLTEGRRGRFVQAGKELVYVRSGREPRSIYPYSRSGRPMLAKPATNDGAEGSRQALREGAQQLSEIAQRDERVSFVDTVWPVFVRTAEALACRRRQYASRKAGSGDGWLDAWIGQPIDAESVLCRINASCTEQPHTETARLDRAFGDAWRGLYPQLVAIVGRGLLCDASWPDFWRYAREMERVAFGPPAVNARKLVALVEAGVVQLESLTTPAPADAHVDCVIPAPHTIASGSLLDQLLRRGLIRRHPSAHGIEVKHDGAAIGSDGLETEGLAVIGRATEGVALGNDTLSRNMHTHPQEWGTAVARRAAAAVAGGVTG
ncbi:MAG: FAD/NAD(P)-binding protein [Planctomycetota bacterium]